MNGEPVRGEYVSLQNLPIFFENEGINLTYSTIRHYMMKGWLKYPVKIPHAKDKYFHKDYLIVAIRYARLRIALEDMLEKDFKLLK